MCQLRISESSCDTEVARFVEEQLAQYPYVQDLKSIIVKQRISGDVFLTLTDEQLEHDGLLARGDRVKLLKLVEVCKEDIIMMRKKKFAFANIAPSSFANDWFSYVNNPESPYLVGREKQYIKRMPVQLLCPVFANFVKRYRNHESIDPFIAYRVQKLF